MSKIQFWKQFTTEGIPNIKEYLLLLICQRYNFESNSQQQLSAFQVPTVVTDMSKIQFWKQFTTGDFFTIVWKRLLLICQRYNFESNSQHNGSANLIPIVVTDMSKIQFWKQFTTFYMFPKVQN